jgi:hypothetical protein
VASIPIVPDSAAPSPPWANAEPAASLRAWITDHSHPSMRTVITAAAAGTAVLAALTVTLTLA